MMQGRVNQRCEAVISVAVRRSQKIKSVDAVIDTGFNGFLSLPIAIGFTHAVLNASPFGKTLYEQLGFTDSNLMRLSL
jgi:predicted aspartyl protease